MRHERRNTSQLAVRLLLSLLQSDGCSRYNRQGKATLVAGSINGLNTAAWVACWSTHANIWSLEG